MAFLPDGTRLYVAEPLPEFDRRRVVGLATVFEPGRIWLEIRMDDGAVIAIEHQPPAVDVRKIEQEIKEALE